MASTPLATSSPPQMRLTLPSSASATACADIYHLPHPEKLGNLIDRSKSIEHVLQIHAAVLRHNLLLHRHPVLNLKLHRAYASHGRLRQSLALFHQSPSPDVFLFTAAINTVCVCGLYDRAFLFYVQMLSSNVVPNEFTFSSILKACPIESGKAIHAQVLKLGLGLGLDPYVTTGLVNFYARVGDVVSAQKVFDRMTERSLVSLTAMITCHAKHGNLVAARSLFDEMHERDVVSWNVMIDGYAQQGFAGKALMLFQKMLAEKKPKPNEITVVAALSACGQIGALESGRWVHAFIQNRRHRLNLRVCTALIDMYSKCGSLDDAWLVFNKIPEKDAVAWNAMIVGCAMHGYSQDALRLFDEMLSTGLRPTDITFIGILSACAHAGLVNEGLRFFNSMEEEYGIEPKIEHYGCLVSLLGRVGRLKEAYKIIKRMNIEADPVLWSALLGGCRLHGDLTLGREIAEYLIGKNVTNSGTYILLSNMYASVGDFDGVARVRKLMKENGIHKEPGLSTIEVDNKVHEFRAGDREHPRSQEIYAMLREINSQLKFHGYVPNTDTVLQDLEEAEKERSLQVHSEKLAIAYGLISTEPGATLKIFKNLRVCSDCHNVTKLISKITGRKIVMRDRNRFHHFVNGSCSCGDFW